MSATLFEMKENLTTLGAQMNKIDDELQQKAMDPATSAEDLAQLQGTKDTLQKRFDIVNQQYKEMNADQKKRLENEDVTVPDDPKQKAIHAYASLIRHTMRPDDAKAAMEWNKMRESLNDDAASAGASFLPVNVSNQLITEPLATNPLRNDEVVTTIPNLVLPRIAFVTGDDTWDDVNDGDVAKELGLKGDKVTFGRHQTRVRAGISDTILYGSDTALVEYVNNALRSGLALKERNSAFSTSPKTGAEHMSFYDTTVVKIKSVAGTDLYEAITDALADLDDAFQDNAKIYMTRKDYNSIIKTLANGSATLFNAQPEQVLGKPVVFTSAATTPVVGDFQYAQTNYDVADALYEQYKDHDKDINYFQVEAWFDHQIKLASAFRLATVASK
ncbi:phage major capsid protein [Furfurilactobacillus entadae]|uniref:phage major capsid protein n=1 Tax=Furfurilactobacillus entadae TaxID=2922307 RepID=UPI0035E76D90